MPQKLSRIQVIDRAHEVHGYKYIYDKMEYVDNANIYGSLQLTCKD